MPFKPISQQKTLKIKQPSAELLSNPVDFIRNLSSLKIDTINTLDFFDNKYETVTVSQTKIAKCSGRKSRSRSNVALKSLEREGLITMKYRHRYTSVYSLSPILKSPIVRFHLSDIIPNFRNVIFATIFGAFAASSAQNNNEGTPYKKGYKEFKSIGGKMTTKNPKVELISPVIKNITCLDLTKEGEADLTRFCDEAILYAEDRFPHKQEIRNRYSYFCSLAHQWHQIHNVPVDYTYCNRLKFSYAIPTGAKMLRTNKSKKDFKNSTRDKMSRTQKTTVTNYYPDHTTKITVKSKTIKEIKEKEAERERRYQESISSIKPRKIFYESTPQSEEFLKMLGLK
jgi:hypothetical protein